MIEIQMKYQDWDKEGKFNETWFLHILNLGWSTKDNEAWTKKQVAELMKLYDEPIPSIIIYAADLTPK